MIQPKPGDKPVPIESNGTAQPSGTAAPGGTTGGGAVAAVKEEKEIKEEGGQSQANAGSGAIFSSNYANSMKPPMAKKRKVIK